MTTGENGREMCQGQQYKILLICVIVYLEVDITISYLSALFLPKA